MVLLEPEGRGLAEMPTGIRVLRGGTTPVQPSPEDVATRVGLDPSYLSNVCDEKCFPALASYVHPWRLVFVGLLSETDLEDVDSEMQGRREQEKRLACLRKWKRGHGRRATCRELVQALLTAGDIKNAEVACGVFKERAEQAEILDGVEQIAQSGKDRNGMLTDLWILLRRHHKTVLTIAAVGVIGAFLTYLGLPLVVASGTVTWTDIICGGVVSMVTAAMFCEFL